MALWKSQVEDHTSDWLRVVLISGHAQLALGSLRRIFIESIWKEVDIGLGGVRDKPLRPADMFLYSWEIRLDVCVDLRVIDDAQCKRVKYMVKYAAIRYGFLPLGKLEDGAVVLLKWTQKISAGKEVDIGLGGGCDKPLYPADMLLYSWNEGLDVCMDLTGSSPSTQMGMVDFVPGRTMIDVAHHKWFKYEGKCETSDIVFSFLFFFAWGIGEECGDPTEAYPKVLRCGDITEEDMKVLRGSRHWARAVVYIFSRISFAIARVVVSQIVSRLPSNLL
uniref:Uncharacterized protein n=1 Tax=Tanacetum cinerariifolium TaxID=118510 RepID=A0A699JTL7_TANCI|nr:hypothetical protein [Tanacetum cinerariifolium]